MIWKKRNLVLGTAVNYDFEDMALFVSTLRRVGYEGEIALLVNQVDRWTRRAFQHHRVTAVRTGALFPVELDGAGAHPQNARIPDRLHLNDVRFYYYRKFLLSNPGAYNRILLADVRDVFFQSDPFALDYDPEALHCALEDAVVHECPYNRRWIAEMFGPAVLEAMKDHRIVCAGTVIGSPAGILKMIEGIIRTTLENPGLRHGSDQASLNHLIFTGQLSVRLCDNGTGPFLTLAHTPNYRIDGDGRVLLGDGRAAPIVHQYDRHAPLVSLTADLVDPQFHSPRLFRFGRRVHNRIMRRMGLGRVKVM